MTANSSHYNSTNSFMGNYKGSSFCKGHGDKCQPNFEGKLRDYLNSQYIYIYLII